MTSPRQRKKRTLNKLLAKTTKKTESIPSNINEQANEAVPLKMVSSVKKAPSKVMPSKKSENSESEKPSSGPAKKTVSKKVKPAKKAEKKPEDSVEAPKED